MTKRGFIVSSIFVSMTIASITVAQIPPVTSPYAPPMTPAQEESGSTLRDLLIKARGVLPLDEQTTQPEPDAMESDATKVDTVIDTLTEEEQRRAQPWRPPDFNAQDGALGWSEKVFEVPKGFEERVQFWRDIYTKYSSDQGILHDRDHIEIIYGEVDFTPIMSDPSKNRYQKARAREKLVVQMRKDITARLLRLNGMSGPEGLSGEDFRVWNLFSGIDDKTKFKDATGRGRVRFQLGQRNHFITGIYHSGRFLREMEKIFREEKLPVELTRIPFVESSFNIRARSRVGASGIWQFMRRTARPYLKMGLDIDERNDPLRASRASARLLKSNYQLLQSWPLAVTGYNHGPNGVKSITQKLKTRDLVEIINTYSSRTFGFASENFYACFLAALEVERNARKYFGDVKWGPTVDAVEVRLKRPMRYRTVVDFFDGDDAVAEMANPHFLPRVRKGRSLVPAGSYIRVPPSRQWIAEKLQSGKLTPAQLSLALKETPSGSAAPVQRTSSDVNP